MKTTFVTVGVLAERLGVSASTVRRLERRGLVPLREQRGTRLYGAEAIGVARRLLAERKRN
jgi:DNA-binding transcriptional MerR regulator